MADNEDGWWLLIRQGRYGTGQQHVIYLPEQSEHELSSSCACIPSINADGVVVHSVLTPNAVSADPVTAN